MGRKYAVIFWFFLALLTGISYLSDSHAQYQVWTKPQSGAPNGGAATFSPLTIGAPGSQAIVDGDAANVLGFRNLANAQVLHVYNTTDAPLTNFERFNFGWAGNVAFIVSEAGGTGTARPINIRAGGAGTITFGPGGSDKWTFVSGGSLTATNDNTYDVGAAGATRPRTVYAATSIISPLYQSTVAKVLVQGTGSGATQLATTQTTPPTCTTNCGTTPSVAGTDTAMIVTLGTTPASAFQVNFNATWAAAPSCVSSANTAGTTKAVTSVTTTTTTATVTTAAAPATGDKYNLICLGVS